MNMMHCNDPTTRSQRRFVHGAEEAGPAEEKKGYNALGTFVQLALSLYRSAQGKAALGNVSEFRGSTSSPGWVMYFLSGA